MSDHVALIVGVGPGLGSALARRFAADGFRVAIAARRGDTLQDLARHIAGHAYTCDVSQESDVAGLFAAVERDIGIPNVVIHNASRRLRGPIDALNPIEVEQTLRVTALGGFFVGQAAARAMIPRRSGSIFFTGATASVKGFAKSAAFAMGKFGLRGLAQSMARELAPQNIHVAHFVIDGAIRVSETSQLSGEEEDRLLDPNAIAQTYADIHRQHRSAWTWEVELRPWSEAF